MALNVTDIQDAVGQLHEQGVGFLDTPESYYTSMPQRLEQTGVGAIDEDIEELQRLGILVDGQTDGQYLLQVFMKEAAQLHEDEKAGPFFYELIQRKGNKGFGEGNFRSLFESIERGQTESEVS